MLSGQLEAAEAWCGKVLAVRSGDSKAIFFRAKARLFLGRLDECEADVLLAEGSSEATDLEASRDLHKLRMQLEDAKRAMREGREPWVRRQRRRMRGGVARVDGEEEEDDDDDDDDEDDEDDDDDEDEDDEEGEGSNSGNEDVSSSNTDDDEADGMNEVDDTNDEEDEDEDAEEGDGDGDGVSESGDEDEECEVQDGHEDGHDGHRRDEAVGHGDGERRNIVMVEEDSRAGDSDARNDVAGGGGGQQQAGTPAGDFRFGFDDHDVA